MDSSAQGTGRCKPFLLVVSDQSSKLMQMSQHLNVEQGTACHFWIERCTVTNLPGQRREWPTVMGSHQKEDAQGQSDDMLQQALL